MKTFFLGKAGVHLGHDWSLYSKQPVLEYWLVIEELNLKNDVCLLYWDLVHVLTGSLLPPPSDQTQLLWLWSFEAL